MEIVNTSNERILSNQLLFNAYFCYILFICFYQLFNHLDVVKLGIFLKQMRSPAQMCALELHICVH